LSLGEPIPIVGGTGALGFGLALRLAAAGKEVVIGSRDAGRAEEAAEKINDQVQGAGARGLENAQAAGLGPIVFLTVPFRAQSENLTNLSTTLQAGQIIVDATAPLAAAISGKATRLLGVPQGSAAEQAQEMVPDGVSVVSALHTVSASRLRRLDAQLEEDVLVTGDRKEDKRRVAEIIAAVSGLRPVNAGALEAARFVEALTPLLISVNIRNKAHAGIRLTDLPAKGLW
jgi:8-hydroxy-5-deazaflavin:NADPH oxidoreductase